MAPGTTHRFRLPRPLQRGATSGHPRSRWPLIATLLAAALLPACDDEVVEQSGLYGPCTHDGQCSGDTRVCIASPYGGGGICTLSCDGVWERILAPDVEAAAQCTSIAGDFVGRDQHLSILGTCLPFVSAQAGSALATGCCLVHHVDVRSAPTNDAGVGTQLQQGACWISFQTTGYLVPYPPSSIPATAASVPEAPDASVADH